MARDSLIKIRRGAAATWTSQNPTLAAGELGYETDTGKLKIGDGSTEWASLAYFAPGGAPSGSAGGDLAGSFPNPTVAKIHETSGPTALTIGTITDGEYLKRSGSTLISGTPSGGSGDVATDNIWDAKGDLAVGSGSNTADNLAIGTDGYVLTADSGQTLGVKWAAASGGIATDGWIAVSGLSYSSTDTSSSVNTGVMATSSDLRSSVGVGWRIKYDQSGTKSGIVTAIDGSSLTVFGGTDYALANAAISNAYVSPMKAPLGFPLDPAKWTIELLDTNNRSQASPTAGTVYNPGSLSLDIHIGCWRTYFEANIGAVRSANNELVYLALSTANNSISDALLRTWVFMQATGATAVNPANFVHRERILTLASKTTYYLVAMSSSNATSLNIDGTVGTTVVRAVCAYL